MPTKKFLESDVSKIIESLEKYKPQNNYDSFNLNIKKFVNANMGSSSAFFTERSQADSVQQRERMDILLEVYLSNS